MNIPLVGQKLSVLPTEYMLVIQSSAGFNVQAEGDVILETVNGVRMSFTFNDGNVPDIDLRNFFRGSVAAASADSSGSLSVAMDTGNIMTVPADEEFEAWNIVGPDDYRVVCMPGGELAVWSSRNQ